MGNLIEKNWFDLAVFNKEDYNNFRKIGEQKKKFVTL